VVSATEMTGLIGAAPATQAEKESYEELIHYTPSGANSHS
jgi:hypothetical protein